MLLATFLIICCLTHQSSSEWIPNPPPQDKEPAGNQSAVSTPRNVESGTVDSCTAVHNQLLSNLFIDYFRSSGPCKAEDGSLIFTFQSERAKMTEEEAQMKAKEVCKSIPSLCVMEKTRSGRFLLGIGQAIIGSFQDKIRRILDLIPGKGYYNAGRHYPSYNYQLSSSTQRYPLLNSILSPQPISSYQPYSPSKPNTHYSPVQHYSPHTGYPSPTAGYHPHPVAPHPVSPPFAIPFQHNPAAVGPPGFLHSPKLPQNQPQFSPPACNPADGSCNHESLAQKVNQKRSVIRKAVCAVITDVVFPMLGKSSLNNSTVQIVQRFPEMVQPVFFKACRSKYPQLVQGKCIQEYIPVNFFIQDSKKSSADHMTQEFVLVESGCRLEED